MLSNSVQVPTAGGGIILNSLQYYDVNNVIQTCDPATYFYDEGGAKVVLNDTTFPSQVSTKVTNPYVLTFSLSQSPLKNLPVIQQAGLLLLTHLYNNRSATSEKGLVVTPMAVDILLRPYKPLVM